MSAQTRLTAVQEEKKRIETEMHGTEALLEKQKLAEKAAMEQIRTLQAQLEDEKAQRSASESDITREYQAGAYDGHWGGS